MSHFSRQHYLYAADWLRRNVWAEQRKATVAAAIALMFSEDNPRFEQKLFYENCGIIARETKPMETEPTS